MFVTVKIDCAQKNSVRKAELTMYKSLPRGTQKSVDPLSVLTGVRNKLVNFREDI